MSKKSRRRNRKILATIAALGGAAMLANRRRNNMINSADANDGFVDTEFKVQDVAPKISDEVKVTPPKINNNTFRTRQKIIDSAGNTVDSAGMTLNRRANAVTGVDGPPTIINPYSSRNIRGGRLINRSNTFRSGGRVKGAGCAKRGFGKAFKGGKK